MDYTDSGFDKARNTIIILYVVGTICAIAFWATIIYICVRGCRKVAERPRVVEINHNGQQQPQIHYIVHQEAIGPDGRSIVYANPTQPGQYSNHPGGPYPGQQQYPPNFYQMQHPNATANTQCAA